jgi:hypothetical protein
MWNISSSFNTCFVNEDKIQESSPNIPLRSFNITFTDNFVHESKRDNDYLLLTVHFTHSLSYQ